MQARNHFAGRAEEDDGSIIFAVSSAITNSLLEWYSVGLERRHTAPAANNVLVPVMQCVFRWNG